jgi:hypothetical protein
MWLNVFIAVLIVFITSVLVGVAFWLLVDYERNEPEPKYCRTCGYKLEMIERDKALGFTGQRWVVLTCPNRRGPDSPHFWRVLREYDSGPIYDPETGAKI